MSTVAITVGQAMVIGGATTLDELADVSITNPQAGQVPVYDPGTQTWKNGSVPAANATTLNGQPGAFYLDRGNQSGSVPAADVAESPAKGFVSAAEKTAFANKVSGQELSTAIATREPAISNGTPGQFFAADKTFKAVAKADVGLSSVDNTSDANKPISTATQAALNTKAGVRVAATLPPDTANDPIGTFYFIGI